MFTCFSFNSIAFVVDCRLFEYLYICLYEYFSGHFVLLLVKMSKPLSRRVVQCAEMRSAQKCAVVQNSKKIRSCARNPWGGGGLTTPPPPDSSCYYTRFASVARYARMLGKLSGPQKNFRFHPCTLSRWKVFAGRRSCACRLQTFLSTTEIP